MQFNYYINLYGNGRQINRPLTVIKHSLVFKRSFPFFLRRQVWAPSNERLWYWSGDNNCTFSYLTRIINPLSMKIVEIDFVRKEVMMIEVVSLPLLLLITPAPFSQERLPLH